MRSSATTTRLVTMASFRISRPEHGGHLGWSTDSDWYVRTRQIPQSGPIVPLAHSVVELLRTHEWNALVVAQHLSAMFCAPRQLLLRSKQAYTSIGRFKRPPSMSVAVC